ncbi:MAG TPA: hypothetical protein PLO78_04100 [Candidatus Omnitrophota bacterium]|nr:hypothetical protein [Candidatus Omnitrophota bacterium]
MVSAVLLWKSHAQAVSLPYDADRKKMRIVFVILYAAAMMIFVSFANRIYSEPDGGLVIGDYAYDDHIWGACVTAELHHRVPPMLPIFSGYKLQYHYLADLFVELLYRMSGTSLRMLEFYYKFVAPISIFWLLGTLIPVFYQYFKRFSLMWLAVLLMVLLPPQISFFYKHHYTLTVLFFVTIVFYLLPQYFESRKQSYAWAAFTLLGFLLLYDAIIGAVTLGAIGLYAAVDSLQKKHWSSLVNYCFFAAILGGICMIALLGFSASSSPTFGLGEGVFQVAARTRFRNPLRFFELLMNFGLSPGNPFHLGIHQLLSFLAQCGAFIVTLFLPLADSPVKYHFLAFPALYAALRRPEPKKEIHTIVAWMFVFAFFISTFVIFKPQGPAVSVLDRAFLFLSVFLMPLTVQAIDLLWHLKKFWPKPLLLAMAVIYLVLPCVRADAFFFRPGSYAYIDRDSMNVFDFIRTKTSPNAVILHPFHDNPIYKAGTPPQNPAMLFQGHYFFMSALGERQTVFEGAVTSTTYFMGHLTYADAVRRLEEVDRFYQTDDASWAVNFLKRYHVDYVWMPKNQPLHFVYDEMLFPVLENNKNVLFAVSRKFHPAYGTDRK